MCGIVGYVSPSSETGLSRSLTVLMDGLGRLEYRGCDSAGAALTEPLGLDVVKEAGKLSGLRVILEVTLPAPATAGIGHIR